MQAERLNSFSEVARITGNDLAWYLVYESIAYAQNSLHVPYDDLEESSLKTSLFMYTMKHYLDEQISRHILFREVRLSQKAFEEAKDFFILAGRHTTFQLSGYLNYLDEWTSEYHDWSNNHPIRMHDLTFALRD